MNNTRAMPTQAPTSQAEVEEYLDRISTFDHYPSPPELFRNGGDPGVTYGLCPVHALQRAQRLGYQLVLGWDRQPFRQLRIVGPKGTAEGVWVLSKGTPIPGAAQGNGQREMDIFGELVDITGIGFNNKPVSPTTPAQVAAAKADVRNGRPPKEENDES